MPKVKILKVNQPGFLPALIRFFTSSKWNHVLLEIDIDSDTVFVELDLGGVFTYEKIPEGWNTEIAHEYETPKHEAVWLIHKAKRFKYSIYENLIYYFAFLFPAFRRFAFEKRRESLQTNCSGFVEMLTTGRLQYRVPGEIEKIWK